MDIRTLADGDVIREPGFYAMSLDRHHSQPCMDPERLKLVMAGDAKPEPSEVSVTSGVLRKMELETPADVWAFHLLNPDRWPTEDRTALRLGRAMAAYVEGGMDEVAKHFLVLPDDKPRRPTSQQIAAYDDGRATEAGIASVEFWSKVDADTRDILTDAELRTIKNMGAALMLDPAACAALGGIPEITMAWQDERTGIWCLSRPDQVAFSGMLSDYKKINTQGRPFNYRVCDRRITDFGYDMQMGFAAEGFEQLTGEWPSSVGVVFQWDKPPHHTILREIADEDLRFGQFRNHRSLLRFSECLASGYWPGPGEDIGAYQRPDWQREQIIEEMNMEGTAP